MSEMQAGYDADSMLQNVTFYIEVSGSNRA